MKSHFMLQSGSSYGSFLIHQQKKKENECPPVDIQIHIWLLLINPEGH